MAKLIWRVKLVAEPEPGIASETELARVEGDDFAVEETQGMRKADANLIKIVAVTSPTAIPATRFV